MTGIIAGGIRRYSESLKAEFAAEMKLLKQRLKTAENTLEEEVLLRQIAEAKACHREKLKSLSGNLY